MGGISDHLSPFTNFRTPFLWHKDQFGPRPPGFEVYRSHKTSRTHTHTHTHTHTLARAPLNEGSARRRGCCLHNTQHTNIYIISGFRTRDPSNQAAANLLLWPHSTGIGLEMVIFQLNDGNFLKFCFQITENQRNVCYRKWLEGSIRFLG